MTWGRGSTRASRQQRAIVLTMWPLCHLGYPGCTRWSTEDDHVIPLSQGGTDDLANHRGACHTCHRKKSQREAAAGRARTRRPTESRHPGLIRPIPDGTGGTHPPPGAARTPQRIAPDLGYGLGVQRCAGAPTATCSPEGRHD